MNKKGTIDDSSDDMNQYLNNEISKCTISSAEKPVDSSKKKVPILYVDVNLANGKVERLTVYEGDTPRNVALQFIQSHGLNDKM